MYHDQIREWLQEDHYPFSYRNSTMADVWFLSAMLGFKRRRRGMESGKRVKSIPCHVFSNEQVLTLRLVGCRLLDDDYRSFLDDRSIYDTLYPYMVGGVEILSTLFKDSQPTFYQQKLTEMILK